MTRHMGENRFRSLEDPDTLRQLVRQLREGIYITNQAGEILDANPACLEMFGVSSLAELRRYQAQDLYTDPSQRSREAEILARDGELRDFEIRLRRPDGEERTVLDTCYSVQDPATGQILHHGILVDITRRKQLEDSLQELSRRDPLTGCYNRRYLTGIADRCADPQTRWGAILVDIDNFKIYNDEHGHQAGDDVLMAVSRFLIRHVRAEDAVIRMGGDEFLVLILGEAAADCAEAAARLQDKAAEEAVIPFSLGWAVREEGERLEQTIDRADHQLLHIRLRERRFRRRRVGQG